MKIPGKLAQELYKRAKEMPREAPAGGAGDIHSFEISAGTVWMLDTVLRKIEVLKNKSNSNTTSARLPHIPSLGN